MGVSKNSGTPKSSILIGFPIIDHPFWGTPIFGNIHITPISFGPFLRGCIINPPPFASHACEGRYAVCAMVKQAKVAAFYWG